MVDGTVPHGLDRQAYLSRKRAQQPARQSSPRRVYTILRACIRRGYFPDGHVFVENELMEQLSATRASVRTALQMLAHDGLVSRQVGDGTLIREIITSIPLGRPGPVLDQDAPRTISSELVERYTLAAPPFLAECLAVPIGAPIVMIENLIRQNGVPSSVFVSYVRPEVAANGPEPPERGDRTAPANERVLLAHLRGVEIGDADVYVEAIACDDRTGRLLGVEVGTPLLQREILLRDAAGDPVQLAFVTYRGDRTALYASGPGVAFYGDTRHGIAAHDRAGDNATTRRAHA